MKILNLAWEWSQNEEERNNQAVKTDIEFKISNFPDGQSDIVLNADHVVPGNIVQITSHFNSWEDMVKIICARVALNNLKVKEIHLFIPYILGARSDRRFQKGGTSYLVDVVAPILNLQGFETVTCFDAHSDVAQGCIKNLNVINNVELVKFALDDIKSNNVVIAAPDQGATRKIFTVAHELKITNPILFCVKHRDQITGKILHTEVPIADKTRSTDYVIVDDICDGGRTFLEIAKEIIRQYTPTEILDLQKKIEDIKEQKNTAVKIQDYEPAARLRHTENQLNDQLQSLLVKQAKSDAPIIRIFLVVSHGIFSARFNELNRYVDGIYTTNSITCYGWDIEQHQNPAKNLKVMDVMNYELNY
jgi:ribose-phosphate pyrophosphokinase